MPDELRRLCRFGSIDHVTAGTGSHLLGVSGSSPAVPDELRRLCRFGSSDHATAGTGSRQLGVGGSSPAKYRNNNLRHTANEYGLWLFLSPFARINAYKIMKYNQL